MSKPIEQIAALTIGTVEFVSPSEIKVILEPNAPQATALNTGVPTGFPRINGYVLIPNETGAVVGLVVWLGVERSQFPKRTGLKDFGLVEPISKRIKSDELMGAISARKPYNILINQEECAIWVLYSLITDKGDPNEHTLRYFSYHTNFPFSMAGRDA